MTLDGFSHTGRQFGKIATFAKRPLSHYYVHELGHALTAYLLGYKPSALRINLYNKRRVGSVEVPDTAVGYNFEDNSGDKVLILLGGPVSEYLHHHLSHTEQSIYYGNVSWYMDLMMAGSLYYHIDENYTEPTAEVQKMALDIYAFRRENFLDLQIAKALNYVYNLLHPYHGRLVQKALSFNSKRLTLNGRKLESILLEITNG